MQISDLTPTQLLRARQVFDAAAPWGAEVQVAALMCAGDEASWLLYANDGSTTRSDVAQRWRDVARQSLAFPHDAVAGSDFTSADSIGLFQQRPMFDYGTVAELMDPAESTRIFVRGSHGGAGTTRFYLQAPAGLTLPQRIQWTQGSEFPTGDNYKPFEPIARQLVALFTQDKDWLSMATQAEVKQAFKDALAEVPAAARPVFHTLYRAEKPNGYVLAVSDAGYVHVPSYDVLRLWQERGLVTKVITDTDQNSINWIQWAFDHRGQV